MADAGLGAGQKQRARVELLKSGIRDLSDFLAQDKAVLDHVDPRARRNSNAVVQAERRRPEFELRSADAPAAPIPAARGTSPTMCFERDLGDALLEGKQARTFATAGWPMRRSVCFGLVAK